jgi:hypothetical protein
MALLSTNMNPISGSTLQEEGPIDKISSYLANE